MRVYISGPMTGLPDLNRQAFARIHGDIQAAGMDAVNPHDLCEPEWDWGKCMRADIRALCDCDAIYMIPGWEKSSGAQLELHVAHRLGLVILLSHPDLLRLGGLL